MKSKGDIASEAKILRAKLIAWFKLINDENEQRADIETPSEWNEDDEAKFKALDKTLLEMIERLLTDKDMGYMLPENDFFEAFKHILTVQTCAYFESYQLNQAATDQQIVEAKEAILAGRLKSLGTIVTTETMCNMSLSGPAAGQKRLLNNMSYYGYLLAQVAKQYSSPDSGRIFLRFSSRMRKAAKRRPIRFDDGELEASLEMLLEGIDALSIDFDYFALKGIDSYRKDHADEFLKQIEAYKKANDDGGQE